MDWLAQMSNVAEDTAAAFCATLVDEWHRSGVRHAVVCPGSRSTPMALALVRHGGLRVSVRLDERGAGFFAVGLALATQRPAVLLTTSGTAAAELPAAVEVHSAVVEAHQARVPLIVCTADRPPELYDVGAPQTIDQRHLYGRAVRWFADLGVPDEAARPSWRSFASRAVAEAERGQGGPGPVHLNLPFREPLMGRAGELPAPRSAGRPWHEVAPTTADTDVLDEHRLLTGAELTALAARRSPPSPRSSAGPCSPTRARVAGWSGTGSWVPPMRCCGMRVLQAR